MTQKRRGRRLLTHVRCVIGQEPARLEGLVRPAIEAQHVVGARIELGKTQAITIVQLGDDL